MNNAFIHVYPYDTSWSVFTWNSDDLDIYTPIIIPHNSLRILNFKTQGGLTERMKSALRWYLHNRRECIIVYSVHYLNEHP